LSGCIGSRTAETTGGSRIFRRRLWERKDSEWAVLDGSGTVASQGFDWYMAEATAAPEKFWEEAERKKK